MVILPKEKILEENTYVIQSKLDKCRDRTQDEFKVLNLDSGRFSEVTTESLYKGAKVGDIYKDKTVRYILKLAELPKKGSDTSTTAVRTTAVRGMTNE